MFRRKNVLNKSHKLDGLTVCNSVPHLCTPHIQIIARSLSRAVNLEHRFNHKDQGRFSVPRKEGHLLVDIEYPIEHGEVINYTLDGVPIHPVTTKIQAPFLTQLPERKENAQRFHHEANGDFKTVTELSGCDRRKLRMDQHCNFP